MFCKKCGNEFEGQFSNKCGASVNEDTKTNETSPAKTAKKKKGCFTYGLAAILLIFVIGTVGSLIGGDDAPSSTTPSPVTSAPQSSTPEVQAIEITSVELLEAYNKNGVNADNLYKGKLLAVSGIVSSIDKDILDEIYVTINAGGAYDIVSVQCYFKDKAEIEKVAALNKGQEITIIGTCDGSLINVQMKKCKIK